jgi:hypothetical protein
VSKTITLVGTVSDKLTDNSEENASFLEVCDSISGNRHFENGYSFAS